MPDLLVSILSPHTLTLLTSGHQNHLTIEMQAVLRGIEPHGGNVSQIDGEGITRSEQRMFERGTNDVDHLPRRQTYIQIAYRLSFVS